MSGLIVWKDDDEHCVRGTLEGMPETTLFYIKPANEHGDVLLLGFCVPDQKEREPLHYFDAQEIAERYLIGWIAAAVKLIGDLIPKPQPEVTVPSFTEKLENGKVVHVHPRASVRLSDETRHIVKALHAWTDAMVADGVSTMNFHPGTALAVMMIHRDNVRDLDAALAEEITPRKTEMAATSRPMVPPHPEAHR